MRILSVGTFKGESNTCRLRNSSLKNISSYLEEVETERRPVGMAYRCAYHLFLLGLPIRLPDATKANKKIIELITNKEFDILWIDKGITINAATLKKARELDSNIKIISYSPDNMALRHNQSYNFLKCIQLYDAHITTKSCAVDELYRLGAKKVIYCHQSFDPDFHYPHEVTQEDITRLGGDVGFVGTWEKERMESILYLSRNGIKVRVFGDGAWNQCKGDNSNLIIENRGLYNEDYPKSFRCFKISLCFLRKMNTDLHTTRSIEIPACGGFMLAERTTEHQELFEEGKEAEYFSSNQELLKKCRYYLEHDKERTDIAESGYRRCISSGYSNTETLKRVIEGIMENQDE